MTWLSSFLSSHFARIYLCIAALALLLAFSSLAGADEPQTASQSFKGLNHLFANATASAEAVVTYQVQQIVRLDEIPKGSKLVRMWIAIPGDDSNQKVMNLNVVTAPGNWKIVEDVDRRGKFLYVEVANPESASMEIESAFTVRRNPLHIAIDPAKVGSLNDALKSLLAEHLVGNAPHMEVTEEFKAIADKVCGDEPNIAIQAALLLQHVAATVDHYSYSKDPNMPTCGIGDAAMCKKQGGGCCTDLNSYFISLARARGIPARLQMGYRLQEKNRDKLVDVGYRCWVEYFVPNYGWVSADIVEADTPGGLGPDRWLSGLTARRIWLNQGREFKFVEDQAVTRINHMSIAYAEIDGKPARLLPEGKLKPQITRQVRFTEIEAPTKEAPGSK